MKRPGRNGFTLLELLLAISLVALITASLMGGVNLGRRSWETSRASEALDEIESAARAVSSLVARSFLVHPEQTQRGQSEPAPVFLGAATFCRFVMLSEGGAQWGGLILTEIGSEGGDELAVWTKIYRPQEGLAPTRATMRKTVLLRGLAALEIAYFGAPQQDQSPAWSGGWRNAGALPTLVSVKISARRLGRILEAASTVAIRQR
ncbi:prepilin-type N-terminal cleavage/methylation domain-containing protein [Methylocystis echinoides]|uniref:prepilin-type N-terminal cleavage/methylation domain-containing protein n=1 Tax=Methylocystis echinoides TaxID=29468 RepID=UPI00344A908C